MPAMTDSEDEYEDYDPNAWKERYKKFMESKPKVVKNTAFKPLPPLEEPSSLELYIWEITDALAELLIKKHKDYGPRNISDAPGGPLNGLRVRIHDKTARINNLIESCAEPENESLQDSFMDLANYAIIAMLVLEGKWDK